MDRSLPICLRTDGEQATIGNGTHVAFEVENRAAVDAYFEAALADGGASNGPPGLRPEYDAQYYAAFVRGPEGNKTGLTFAAK